LEERTLKQEKQMEAMNKLRKIVPEGPGKISKSDKKLLRSKSVLIEDLPETIAKNVLYKKVRKYGTVSELVLATGENGLGNYCITLEPGTAKVVYSSSDEAINAIKHLNAHVYKGVTIKCKQVESVDDAAIAKKARLIIRNLSFHTKKENLIKVFEAYGDIVDCTIPVKHDGKTRGFGFIQFQTVEEAQKAITGVNGQSILKRPVAVDWALGKAQYERLVTETTEENDEPSDDPEEENYGIELPGEDAIIDDRDLESDAESDDSELVDPELVEKCTLFIRNLSFDTTKEAISKCFENWGPLRYALITKDKVTTLSRGNGFVSFQNLDDCEKCLSEFEEAQNVQYTPDFEIDSGHGQEKGEFYFETFASRNEFGL
jgi:nucleolar protein 4